MGGLRFAPGLLLNFSDLYSGPVKIIFSSICEHVVQPFKWVKHIWLVFALILSRFPIINPFRGKEYVLPVFEDTML